MREAHCNLSLMTATININEKMPMLKEEAQGLSSAYILGYLQFKGLGLHPKLDHTLAPETGGTLGPGPYVLSSQ